MAKRLYHPDIEQIDLSMLLDALSDPVRRRIVLRLAAEKELPCGHLNDEAPKSNLTYHYAKLREAGVTKTRLEGPYRYISLRLEELEARFPGILSSVITAAQRE